MRPLDGEVGGRGEGTSVGPIGAGRAWSCLVSQSAPSTVNGASQLSRPAPGRRVWLELGDRKSLQPALCTPSRPSIVPPLSGQLLASASRSTPSQLRNQVELDSESDSDADEPVATTRAHAPPAGAPSQPTSAPAPSGKLVKAIVKGNKEPVLMDRSQVFYCHQGALERSRR